MKSLTVFKGNGEQKDKYNGNIIHQMLINNFMKCILELLKDVPNKNIFEIGCGEGQIMGVLFQNGYSVSGIDYSENAVNITLRNFKDYLDVDIEAKVESVYNIDSLKRNCTVVCCEVLEHLDDPQKALGIISEIAEEYFLVSVPREPLWRVLNLMRGKYIRHLGNTPGHINHWGGGAFVALCKEFGEVVTVRTPWPWTMVLVRKNTQKV